MGMPITVEIIDKKADLADINRVFEYFRYVDNKFSTYKNGSEITRINKKLIDLESASTDMKEIMSLCEITKKETFGFFDISKNGKLDPSGLVKGWAINNAADSLRKNGFKNYYVNAGGDVQVRGKNKDGNRWTVGIQNPFNLKEIVKAIAINEEGVATSGIYIRGQHIYNPYDPDSDLADIVSLTVIGPNIYEADRFATAAFAMGKRGIEFIDSLPGFEGYMIDKEGVATETSGFDKYIFTAI